MIEQLKQAARVGYLGILALSALWMAWTLGYVRGQRHGRLEVETSALRNGVAFRVIREGAAEFQWRYVPRWRDDCVIRDQPSPVE